MTEYPKKTFAQIEVIAALREHEPVLANLLELYIHDLSEFINIAPGPDGRFGYPRLRLYWSEPGRYPFLVKIDGQWAGFAFVKTGSEVSGDETVWDMAEFFVLRGYRRRGIGTQIAHEVWRKVPGLWEVRVMGANVVGRDFWNRAIAAFTGEEIHAARFEKDGEFWDLFSFVSRPTISARTPNSSPQRSQRSRGKPGPPL
jgi:predicted acetyltransferase